jgi:hypothetical protein
MKYVITVLALLLSLAPAAAQKKIPLQASHWEISPGAAAFSSHLGIPALHLKAANTDATGSNMAFLKDITFANGTIEYDVAFRDDTRFTSIHFRRKDADNSEHFYLRSNAVDDPNVNSAVQYAAILKGVNLWDLSVGYQSNATLKKEAWNHVKLIIRDRQLLAYVNDMETPALYVPKMDGDWSSGQLAFDGNVWLANVSVTPNLTTGLRPGEGYDVTDNDPRYLRNWQVSDPTDLPRGTEPTDLPAKDINWEPISSGRHGIVNLSRKFGATPKGERRITWLKTTISTAKPTTRSLDFGFSDEVYVYLNGKPLYVDKNLFNTPGMKTPRGRASIENSRFDLPLAEGENELLIGVTNFFFGWGIVARLDDGGKLRY